MIVIIFCLSLLFLYYALPIAVTQFLKFSFKKHIEKTGFICLTFDDGPDPRVTPQILDELHNRKIKATFFLLGRNVEKYPDLSLRIVDEGHEIGEHSYSHTHPWKTGPLASARDLLRGEAALEKIVHNQSARPFRPPYGKFNLVSLFIAMIWKRKRFFFWNVDTLDYQQLDGKPILEKVLKYENKGKVILMHDGRADPGETVGNTMATVDGLIKIVDSECFKKAKYVTASELIDSLNGRS